MSVRPIRAVYPLKDYVLRVEFETGSVVLLDMGSRLHGIRFRPLRNDEVWENVCTDGIFVRWGDTELAFDEILQMAAEQWERC